MIINTLGHQGKITAVYYFLNSIVCNLQADAEIHKIVPSQYASDTQQLYNYISYSEMCIHWISGCTSTML